MQGHIGRRVRILAVVGVVLVAPVVPPRLALAHHEVGGEPLDNMMPTTEISSCQEGEGHFCKTDNTAFTHYTGYLGTIMDTATHWTHDHSWDTTDLNSSEEDPVVLTGGSETDVVYKYTALSVSVGGRTWCDDNSPGGNKCDQHYVEYDDELCDWWADCDPVDWNAFRTLACHETGHAVGLTHGSDADPDVSNSDYELRCMRTPAVTTDPNVGTHNASMVNSTY